MNENEIPDLVAAAGSRRKTADHIEDAAGRIAEATETLSDPRANDDRGAVYVVECVAGAISDLEDALAAAVRYARDEGVSWQGIANTFGISRQAAQQRFRG